MNLLVRRTDKSSISTIGELLINGEHICFTMEPPYASSGIKPRAIPLGTYDLTIRWSAHWARLMPHVENVPDFEEIEIHPGNYPHQTKGCLMVGKTKPIPDFLGQSLVAFNPLFTRLSECKEPMTICYTEA